jgi:hypothetical protein
MKRYGHVISKERHPSWERGQRDHTSPRCPLSSFTSFSDSCDVAGPSLSKLLPARDVVEEVEFLILCRQGSLSRLIDASYSVHLRLLRNQRYKPPSNPPKCRVISRLGIFTVRGPLLSQVSPHPVSGWNMRVQVVTHASQKQSFLSLERQTETSSINLFISHGALMCSTGGPILSYLGVIHIKILLVKANCSCVPRSQVSVEY